MLPIDRCPICGREVAEKEVTETVFNALVCVSCGERFYPVDIVKKIEEMKKMK